MEHIDKDQEEWDKFLESYKESHKIKEEVVFTTDINLLEDNELEKNFNPGTPKKKITIDNNSSEVKVKKKRKNKKNNNLF